MIFLVAVVHFILFSLCVSKPCPPKCVCSTSSLIEVKVACFVSNSEVHTLGFELPANTTHLQLSNSSLSSFPIAVFAQLPKLRHLNLQSNYIRELPYLIMRGKQINLNDNPLDCNCNAYHFAKREQNVLNGTCAQPPKMRGRPVIESFNGLKCDPEETITRYPKIVFGRNLSSTMLFIQWTIVSRDDVLKYHVGYVSYIERGNMVVIETSKAVNGAVISQLKYFTMYEIYVRAVTRYGVESWSKPFFVKTDGIDITTTPSNLKMQYLQPTLVIVSWDEFDAREIDGGLVVGCLVNLTALGVDPKLKSVPGNNNSAVLDGLWPEMVYTVKVAYISTKGIGHFSRPLYINSPKDDPCVSLPCVNGGSCKEDKPQDALHTSVHCSCLPSYTGTFCQHYSTESPENGNITCTSPKIALPTISDTLVEATVVFKSNILTIKNNIVTLCKENYRTYSTWKIIPVGSPKAVFGGHESRHLSVPQNVLDYGRYVVNLTVQMEGVYVYSIVFGYIHVTPGLLVAYIKGGHKVIREANGRNIVLDASESRDLDTRTSRGLSFIWLCRTSEEYFPNNTWDYPMVEKPIFFPGKNSTAPYKRGGCYGNGPGKIPGNGPLLEFEGYYVVVNTLYIFTVIVRSGHGSRRASFSQEVQVIPGSQLDVSISCLKNCHNKPDPNSKIAFTCNNASCDDNLRYKWSAFYKSKSKDSWQEILNLQDQSETPLTSKVLILQAFGLLPGRIVRLTLTVNTSRGRLVRAERRFTTNTAPKYGHCSVSPKHGTALKTIYNFRCYNWSDPDQPITYAFSYMTSDGIVHILQKGVTSYLSVTLPPGDDPHTPNRLRVNVEIADSIGTYTTVSISVQVIIEDGVDKQEGLNFLSALAVGNSSELNKLIHDDKTQRALQLSRNVLLMLKEYESDPIHAEATIKIKSTIIDKIASIKVKSLKEIGDTASVIAQATHKIGDVNPEAENKAAKTLVSLTSVLEEKGTTDQAEYKTLLRGTQGLVGGIGNVLRIVSYNAELDRGHLLKNDTFLIAQKNILQDLMNATERVGGVLLSRILVGEKPTIIGVASMALLLSNNQVKELEGISLVNMKSSFTFPSDSGIFGQGITAVSSQMLVTNFTMFTWDETSKKVSSQVVHMEIKDKSGNKIPLENLSSPVEIKLPQRIQQDTSRSNKYNIGFGRTVYHKFDIKDENMSLAINLIPQDDTSKLVLAVTYQRRPSRAEDFLFPFPREPDISTSKLSGLAYTYSDPYTLHIGKPHIFKAGRYFIGIRVGVDVNKLNRNHINSPTFGTKTFPTSVIYQLEIRASQCLFWKQEEEKWTSDGCRVSSTKTAAQSVVCLCYHLTSFASQFYVAPNPLDFDKVFIEFTRLHETGNVASFVALGCVFGTYVLVIFWARREDKKDQLKVGLKSFLGVSTPNSRLYQLSITTGVWRNAGTTANVYIILHGELEDSGSIHLVNPSCVPFSRGNTDIFLLSFPENLGKIKKVRIWHDNSGTNPSWFLSHVRIQSDYDDDPSLFIFQQWLAVDKGAGFVDRTKNVANKKELGCIARSIYEKLSEQFANEHLWFSVFARTPNSPFTRVQRVTCCLSLILSIMVCNAMFYEFAPQPSKNTDPSIKVGPIRLKLRQLIIAIQSALIIAPLHMLIVLIFEHLPTNTDSFFTKQFPFTMPIKKLYKRRIWTDRKTRIVLPKMFVYVAYFLCFLGVLTSSSFIVFYSLYWGSDITNQWLISIVMSLTVEIFIAKPVLLLIVMMLVSLLCRWRVNEFKDPQNLEQGIIFTEEDVNLNSSHLKRSFVVARSADFKDLLQPPKPPTRQQLRKARRLKLMIEEFYEWLFDVVILLLYISILFAVSYRSRDKQLFTTSMFIKNTFQHFEPQMDTFFDFWEWSGNVLPKLYKEAKSESSVIDSNYVLVGLPKITQKRVIKDKCKIAAQFKSMIKRCTHCYSLGHEETKEFTPWWAMPKAPTNASTFNFSTASFQKAWTYSSSGIFIWSHIGFLNFYSSGGYIARLGHSVEETLQLLRILEHYLWIDFQTVALFVSFTIYSPQTSLFSCVKIILEMNAAGVIKVTRIVQPIHFYDVGTGYEIVLLVFQLSLPIFIIYYVVQQIRRMKKGWLEYFSVIFNWVEWIQIFCTILWMVIHVYRMIQTDKNSKLLTKSILQDNDFELVVLLNDVENTLLALMIFFNTLKLLLIIQFSHVKHFFGILKCSFKELVSYAILFCIALFAFAHFGFLVFGSNVFDYSDVFKALSQLCHAMVGGKLNLEELQNTHSILGPVFFVLFVVLSMVFFVNVCIMIIIHYYGTQIERYRNAYGLGMFIVDRIKEACGFGRTVIPDEWTEMDEIRLQCHISQVFDHSEMERLVKPQKYQGLIGYKGVRYQKTSDESSGGSSSCYHHSYASFGKDQNTDQTKQKKYWNKLPIKEKETPLQTKETKPINKNISKDRKRAVSFKLHRINALINSVYAGDFLEDIDIVRGEIMEETSQEPKEKTPQSITEIFESKVIKQTDRENALPQSIPEIFGC